MSFIGGANLPATNDGDWTRNGSIYERSFTTFLRAYKIGHETYLELEVTTWKNIGMRRFPRLKKKIRCVYIFDEEGFTLDATRVIV